jgi:two-component system KDP operon response regulator KdpE
MAGAMWNDQTRLLLIDDDARLTDATARYLQRSGYAVDTANSGEAGLARFQATRPDLVILDLMMPGMDGWELCRRLRETSRTPIILLTARSGETDRVMGLRMGADDYLVKPFSLKELEARIEAVLRRVHMEPPSKSHVLYDDGHLRLETAAMQVQRDGRSLDLTATERRLLFVLAEQANRILSLEQILHHVWGPEYSGQPDYVKLYIWRLRQKLEVDPRQPVYIHTERGLGYRFVPHGRAVSS